MRSRSWRPSRAALETLRVEQAARRAAIEAERAEIDALHEGVERRVRSNEQGALARAALPVLADEARRVIDSRVEALAVARARRDSAAEEEVRTGRALAGSERLAARGRGARREADD